MCNIEGLHAIDFQINHLICNQTFADVTILIRIILEKCRKLFSLIVYKILNASTANWWKINEIQSFFCAIFL